MSKYILLASVLFFVIVSGCTQSQQQTLINTAAQAMNSLNDFDTVAEYQMITEDHLTGQTNTSLFVQMHLTYLTQDKMLVECVTSRCMFGMSPGDKAIVNGNKTYLFKASENAYSLCEQDTDLARSIQGGVKLKTGIATFLQAASTALVMNYDGLEDVEGEPAHKIRFDYAGVSSDSKNYLYIRASDFMPVKMSTTYNSGGSPVSWTTTGMAIGRNLRINTGIQASQFEPEVAFAGAREVTGLCGVTTPTLELTLNIITKEYNPETDSGELRPLPNAAVVLTDNGNQVIATGTTDREGNVVFSNLYSGQYFAEISAEGYETIKYGVPVRENRTEQIVVLR